MSRRIALYPIVLAVALVVELIVVSGVSPFAAGRSLIAAAVIGALLSIGGRLLLGDAHRGGVFAVLGILLVVGGTDGRIAVLVLMAMALLFVERYAFPADRRRLRWPLVGRLMTGLATILVVAVGIQGLQNGAPELMIRTLTAEGPLRPASVVAAGRADHPDIYVLFLDGYARADALDKVFGYDDSAFLAELESRGFDVSRQSRANYPLTSLTLASMFDMRLLADSPAVVPLLDHNASLPSGAVIRGAINDNRLFHRLHELGYEIDALSSGFEEVSLREADRFHDTGDINEFEISMLRKTIFGRLLEIVAPDAVSAGFRARLQGELATVKALAEADSPRPRFVFAHLPSPHPPWVYHADGSPRTVPTVEETYADVPPTATLPMDDLRAGYVGTIEYLHGPVLATIDAILAASDEPPVILVMSDHGSWIGADNADLRLRFLSLFAAYVPGSDRLYPDDMAIVNIFPTLLAELFGDNVPLVDPAPSYMYRLGDPYDHIEVDDPNAATAGP